VPWHRWVAVLSLGGFALGGAWLGSPADLSAVPPTSPRAVATAAIVSPPPTLPLRFSHAAHRKRGLSCGDCHGPARKSTRARDVLLPGKKACLQCHPEARVPEGYGRAGNRDTRPCRKCHRRFNAKGFPAAVVWRAPRFRFNHRLHLAKGSLCLDCHAGVDQATGRDPKLHLPKMKHCFRCHRKKGVGSTAGGVKGARGGAKGARAGAKATRASATGEGAGAKATRASATGEGAGAKATRARARGEGAGPKATRAGAKATRARARGEGAGSADGPGATGGPKRQKEAREGASHAKGTPRASARCVTCHERLPGGRMRSTYPEGKLVPGASLPHLRHGPTFRKRHAVAANAHRSDCQACHLQATCLRCHGGVRRPASIHLGNWILRHGRQARANRKKCKACHTRQRFCLSCHSRVGFNPRSRKSPYGVPRRKQFHGPSWASSTRRGVGANRHAVHARRNISTCVSCHRETDCMRCHARRRTGGLGRSPHPPGFRNGPRCRRLMRKNRRACLKCHGFNDPLLSLCR